MTAVLIIRGDREREKAADWIRRAPPLSRITFKGPKRTLPQNDRFWATLTVIAEKVRHHGIKLSAEDWKLLFLDALDREVRLVPNLDGSGFVNLSRSSSDLSKEDFSDLLEIIQAWAAANGVDLREPESEAA
jgi:hypothetical protein